MDWEWGFVPLSSTNPPTDEVGDYAIQAKEHFPRIAAEKRGPRQKRDLNEVDPDPYIQWTNLKMGRTHTSRPGNFSVEAAGSDDDVTILEGKKNKAPAPEAGSSQGPPAKRSRTDVVGGKAVGKRRYQGKQMPVASGPALKLSKSASGLRPESSEGTARTSSPVHSSPVPSDHRAEEEHISPLERQDTSNSNIGADFDAAGRAEPQVPPVPKRKKKTTDSSPSKPVPDSSAPASSTPGQDAPDARSSPKTSPAPPPEAPTAEQTGATPTPPPSQGHTAAEPVPTPSQGPAAAKPTPPPEGTKPLKPEYFKGKATASGTATSGSQQLALHVGRAAVVAGEAATGLLGQITELKRGGHKLGHLLEYAEKWSRADVYVATRGLGKDRLPAIDTAGPRCTEQHFIRLRRAVKELDNAWHDATNNVVLSRKPPLRPSRPSSAPFKEQLIQEHRKALDTQKAISRGLKDKLIQFGLRHDQEMKDAKAAAKAKLNEALEDSINSTSVLRAELEEGGKARKAAEDRAALLEAEQKEYDQLVMQTDALALRLFPDSQVFVQRKVSERRVQQEFKNPEAPWDPYDHLVALSARV
nr:actin cytoskeleton-regulatory complex protein PAN1-like [Lolium perenne]